MLRPGQIYRRHFPDHNASQLTQPFVRILSVGAARITYQFLDPDREPDGTCHVEREIERAYVWIAERSWIPLLKDDLPEGF